MRIRVVTEEICRSGCGLPVPSVKNVMCFCGSAHRNAALHAAQMAPSTFIDHMHSAGASQD